MCIRDSYCKEHHIKYKEYTDFNEETIADADILYMTRVQRERFTDLMEYERVKLSLIHISQPASTNRQTEGRRLYNYQVAVCRI